MSKHLKSHQSSFNRKTVIFIAKGSSSSYNNFPVLLGKKSLQIEAQAKETTQEALKNAQQEVQDLKNEREQLRAKIEDLEVQQNVIY